MNQEFFDHALEIIENISDEELYEALRSAGIDATIRQYPEPEDTDQGH